MVRLAGSTNRRISGNVRRLISYLLIMTLVIILMPFTSYAEENSEDKEEQKTVKVGYFQNDIFQEGAEEGQVRTGYAYEYYLKLSEYTGWKYEYVYGSFSDMYQMLLDGDVDLLAGLAKTEERESIIGYPHMAMGSETYNLERG